MPIVDLHEDRAISVKAVAFGHIRLGFFNGRHPVQSDTFIFTSKDPQRLAPLAARYGGTVERYEPQGAGEEPWRVITEAEAITALPAFPTFEESCPQSWELWGSGGIKRSCTGRVAELIDVDEVTGEITSEDSECLCALDEERVCAPVTRLHLLLPETGLGVWTLQTQSKVAATELYDQMRLVETVAPDRLNHVPVRLIYGMRKIHYRDPKSGKRTPTTKRIVSVSIAGDARQALAPLGMEPDRALLAAVVAVLGEGSAPALAPFGEGGASAPALPSSPQDRPAESQAEAPESVPVAPADPSGEVAGESEARSGTSEEPATPEQWRRWESLGLGKQQATLRARKQGWDIGRWQEITTSQLAVLIDEVAA